MHYNVLTASSSPNSANKFNPIVTKYALVLFPQPLQFLVYFVGSVSPLSQCFENKFHPMFCTYSLVPLPPLAFPLTTVRCRVPPPLDRLSPNCQYGHFPTSALNERPTKLCSMVGPLILGRERRHYQPTKWPLSDPKHDKVHSQPIVCFDQ